MQVVAKGKDAVLKYLEEDAARRSPGHPGEWALTRDDSGNLIAFIAGHSFIGAGTYTLGGNRILVVDGIVINIQQP